MMAHLRKTLVATLVQWIPLAALTVLLTGMIYVATQQSYRSGANDPQIQMATDTVSALEGGAAPQDLVTVNKIDISHSLAPYLAIYDTSHQIVATRARQAASASHFSWWRSTPTWSRTWG